MRPGSARPAVDVSNEVAEMRTLAALLPLAVLVLTGCERLADDYRKDRGVMKILRDGEYRIVEEEF